MSAHADFRFRREDCPSLRFKRRGGFHRVPGIARILARAGAAVAIGIGLAAAQPASSAAADARLVNPFSQISRDMAVDPTRPVDCPAAPEPVVGVLGVPYYSDKNHSVVDPVRYAQNIERSKPVIDFQREVATRTARALAGRDGNAAACVVEQIYTWARGGAFLGKFNSQGLGYRRWITNSLAIDFLALRDVAGLDQHKIDVISKWLDAVGDVIRSTAPAAMNNHALWSAAAVSLTAIAANNKENFGWAMEQARRGIGEIDAAGAMPSELIRGVRAMRYHVFAVEPLLQLAFVARANGTELLGENDGALQRMVELVMRNLDDPREVGRLSNHPDQDWGEAGPHRVAWAVPYFALTGDCRAVAFAATQQPLVRSYMGGNVQLLYNVKLSCRAERPAPGPAGSPAPPLPGSR